ncbi:hypothetical protein BCR34DRAFT_625301 [Clohesyomyces aquaticus]|uniref:Uncharacterized protein n=1 Tax=Clohesyomyces aquaticus TaxID=1231657 RepID=A0A1Y1ZKT3_9PLEO|nr:hypothetical protein BCR34DRAFT_625301 [Clohesyomyces aquaticus]
MPEPFTPAPTELLPLLSTFSKDAVYIIHIDTHPAWFKRRIFFVPVGLNVAIAAFLIFRAYMQIPFYWALLMSFLGNPNDTTIYYADTKWFALFKVVGWRGMIFLADWMLFGVVGRWPWTFFFERPGNPVSWRWSVGFRDEEVYIRGGRGWTAKDLLGDAEGSTGKAGGESPFFKTKILPAVDSKRLREKTGYLLMDSSWDHEFSHMVTATRMLDNEKIPKQMLRKTVCVWVGAEESGQWAVWNCWKLDQKLVEGSETEARQQIVKFKDRLTTMGKENLFFKWVELVQYESNAPGGFTQERQIATAEKTKRLFEDQGVDFDAFVKEIGGMPGIGKTV